MSRLDKWLLTCKVHDSGHKSEPVGGRLGQKHEHKPVSDEQLNILFPVLEEDEYHYNEDDLHEKIWYREGLGDEGREDQQQSVCKEAKNEGHTPF